MTLEVNGNAGFQNVDFYDSAFTNGLGMTSASLVGYNLTSNLSNVPETFVESDSDAGQRDSSNFVRDRGWGHVPV